MRFFLSNIIDINLMDKSDLYISKANFVEFRTDNITNAYEFIKQIGRGAYGVVYKARQRKQMNGQYRAIKKIIKKSVRNQNSIKNQIQNLVQLDHPSILKIYEIFEDEINLFLVTDLCEGGQLFDRLQRLGSFSQKEARAIFTQILEAMNYCHKQKIAHRDLKPQNLLFLNSSSLNLKLIDFGLSFKWVNDMCQQLIQKNDTKLVGTSYYLAPQIIAGSYDYRCDLWSAGVILYILVTAVPPFDGQNDKEIIASVKKGFYTFQIPQMQAVSAECKDLIKRLLMPDSLRISVNQAFNHPWIKANLHDKPLQLNFQKLNDFRKYSKLKKIIANYIASKLSEKQVEKLGILFKQLDVNHDGAISIEELKAALQSQKDQASYQQIKQIMSAVDTDKNGLINYTQFIASCLDSSKMFTKQNIIKVFKTIDKDGNGMVDRNQLKQILQKNNYSQLNGKLLDQIMKECDKNQDGKIDFNEFFNAMIQ